jgi:hypothetical protein
LRKLALGRGAGRAALVLFVVLLLACKRAGSQKLEGRWRGTKSEGSSPDQQPNATAFATGTEIIARGDQIAVTTPAGKPIQATYVVDLEDARSVVIHTDKDGPSARETFTFTDDGKQMTWRVDQGRTITFQRVGAR